MVGGKNLQVGIQHHKRLAHGFYNVLGIFPGILDFRFQLLGNRAVNDRGKNINILTFDIVHHGALKLAMDHRAVFFREFDFTFMHARVLQNSFKVTGKNPSPLCIGNKTGKGFIGQLSPLYSQQLRAGKIYLPHYSGRIKSEIGDRCKVI